MIAASVPTQLETEIALIPVGVMAVFFGSTANGHMQIWSAPELRGRVMAIYTLLTLGTTVVGGPFVGWVCQHWSPRTGLGPRGVRDRGRRDRARRGGGPARNRARELGVQPAALTPEQSRASSG